MTDQGTETEGEIGDGGQGQGQGALKSAEILAVEETGTEETGKGRD